MNDNAENRNLFIRVSEYISDHSWLHFLSSLCIGIWVFYFFSIGGGFLGGIGFGALCFIAAYVGITALPASIYEAIDRPWVIIVQVIVMTLFLVIYKII